MNQLYLMPAFMHKISLSHSRGDHHMSINVWLQGYTDDVKLFPFSFPRIPFLPQVCVKVRGRSIPLFLELELINIIAPIQIKVKVSQGKVNTFTTCSFCAKYLLIVFVLYEHAKLLRIKFCIYIQTEMQT